MHLPGPFTENQPKDYIFQLNAPTSMGDNHIDLLFAARTSGLYLSGDGGQTWESAYKSLNIRQELPTIAVCLSPDFEHEPHVFAGLSGAVLRSYNGGADWQQSRLPTPPPAVSSLVASPNYPEDGIVFAGTNEDGVLISNDRGRSWVSWNFGLLDLNILCLAISPDFTNDETIYAGCESGIFRSTNGGRAWRELTLPVGYDSVLSLAISQEYAQDNILFAGTENKGLLISLDRGKNWQGVDEATSDQPVNSVLLSSSCSKHEEILILHGSTLKISKDCGKTWKRWQVKKLAGSHITAVLAPHGFNDGVFVGCEDGAVMRV
jgi:photosystem II stability/assembly factor-like uncharacterized protein